MKYLKLFTDFAKRTELLSDAECGRLFKAMLEYAKSGIAPELKGNEKFIFSTVKVDIDAQRESYDSICDRNQRNISSRYQSLPKPTKSTSRNDWKEDQDQDQEQDQEQKNKKVCMGAASRFTPPTVAEVAEYCKERNNSVDADSFVDFYTSKGWMVGKNRMKDWKAAVRQWERGGNYDSRGISSSASGNRGTPQGKNKRDWDIEYSG